MLPGLSFSFFRGSWCDQSDHGSRIIVLTVFRYSIKMPPSFSLTSWLHVLSTYVDVVALFM
jgi:hypothetical protein